MQFRIVWLCNLDVYGFEVYEKQSHNAFERERIVRLPYSVLYFLFMHNRRVWVYENILDFLYSDALQPIANTNKANQGFRFKSMRISLANESIFLHHKFYHAIPLHHHTLPRCTALAPVCQCFALRHRCISYAMARTSMATTSSPIPSTMRWWYLPRVSRSATS